MYPYRRSQVDRLIDLLTRDRKPLIVAVTGPRQAGKTTVIRQALKRVNMPGRYLAVDEAAVDPSSRWARGGDPGGSAWLHQAWREARRRAERSERGFVLALDEIQHVDRWSLITKALWDRDRRSGCPLRVIVAGSAPWSMMTGLHESLAGRFMPVQVGHWSYAEMAECFGFTLDQYLFFGGYPGMATEICEVDAWRAAVHHTIVSPAIEKDIVALARIKKPALMRRLMELAADYSGQILSWNKMLGQLQEAGNRTTLAEYLDLLSGAGLVTGLSGYSGARYRARGSSPKLNVLNTALMTVPLRRSFQEVLADRTLWGRIVESAVGAHLHNTAGLEVDVHHWRDGPHEVDFVLSRGLGPMGIEVKSGRRRARTRGREAFRDRFPEARTLVVGKHGIPLDEFLSKPARHWVDYGGPSCAAAGSGGEGGAGAVREPVPLYTGKAWTETWTRPLVPGRRESVDPVTEHEQREFMSCACREVVAVRRGRGDAWLWHRVGRAYMSAVPGSFDAEPTAGLRALVESHETLLDAALQGLPHFVHRGDIPPLVEIVRMDETSGGAHYPYPVLAGLAETARLGHDPLHGLDAEAIRRAVGCYYLADYVREPPWYRRAIDRHPQLCAEALVTVYRSRIRRRSGNNSHLFALSHDAALGDVARLAAPALLGVFPTRCTRPQVSALHALLWAGVLYLPKAELADRVRRRSSANGMDAAQRALWLAAGLFHSAKEYRPEVVAFVSTGREQRAHHLLDFLVPGWPARNDLPEPWNDWDAADIMALFKAFGRWFDPWRGNGGCRYEATTRGLRVDWLLKGWIEILRQRPGAAARAALAELLQAPVLDRWYDEISGWQPDFIAAPEHSTGTA